MPNGRKPDYLIEGKIFDCYAPAIGKDGLPTKVRSIYSEVHNKLIKKEQTDRVVLNLQDWHGDFGELEKQFKDWPPDPRLQEIIVIKTDGSVLHFYPF